MSVRKTIVCIALGAAVTLLAACGGGSGGGGGTAATVAAGGDGGRGGGSGAQGGAVATVDTAPIPGYQDGDNVLPIGASNNGFYMQVNAADDTSRVVKVHGNPFFNHSVHGRPERIRRTASRLPTSTRNGTGSSGSTTPAPTIR